MAKEMAALLAILASLETENLAIPNICYRKDKALVKKGQVIDLCLPATEMAGKTKTGRRYLRATINCLGPDQAQQKTPWDSIREEGDLSEVCLRCSFDAAHKERGIRWLLKT